VAGGAVSEKPYFPTTVNPLWRQALLHIDLPISWPNTSSLADIVALETYLTSHTLALGTIAQFEGGQEAGYSSESDYNEAQWQKVWYGETYP